MSVNQPPPPPPPLGSPAPPHDWDLGAAVTYGWIKFQTNLVPMIAATLVLVAGAAAIFIAGFIAVGALTSTREYVCEDDFTTCDWEGGTPFIVQMFLFMLTYFVAFVFAQVVGASLIRGALGVTAGRPFEIGEIFRLDGIGPVLVTSLIVGAGTFVGGMLCYVPGIVVGFVCSYALFFVIDQNMAPMDAIKASFDLVRNNLGTTIVWYLVAGLIVTAGAIVCGVGLLVTIPIALLGTAFTYRKLTGQQIAA